MEDKEAPNSAFTMSIKGMPCSLCAPFLAEKSASMAEYVATLFSSSQPQLPVSSFPLL